MKIDSTQARELWLAGATDQEIAGAFGTTTSAASRWRRKQGLPPIGKMKTVQTKTDMPPAPPEELVAETWPQSVESMTVNGQLAPVPEVDMPSGEYDPIIYDAFDLAVAMAYRAGRQPGMIWRQLLVGAERHMLALAGYLPVSEEAARCAVELAARATVDELLAQEAGNANE